MFWDQRTWKIRSSVKVGERMSSVRRPHRMVVWVDHLCGVATQGNWGDIVGKRVERSSGGVETRKAIVARGQAGWVTLVARVLVDRPPLPACHDDRLVNTVKSICWGATLGRRDLSKGGAGQKVLQRSNSWSSYACVLLDFSLSILPGQKHYTATWGEQKGLLY